MRRTICLSAMFVMTLIHNLQCKCAFVPMRVGGIRELFLDFL